MNHEQLNKYIKHYLEEDKTKSAIMLTAPWGTGKSYYIQNILTPFLETGGAKCCVVVSLYGLNTITEVNRSLYLEMRFNKITPSTEIATSAVTLGKTVLKGVTSFFGVDISLSEDELNKLYTSLDFKGKLIIFEDLERTGIDILKFLGYTNNLVEQDGIKVLLVANEDEIFQYQTKDGKIIFEKDFEKVLFFQEFKRGITGKDDKSNIELTDVTKQYIRTKEKSISDTLTYTSDNKMAINNIISRFDDKWLSEYKNEESLSEIINILDDLKQSNLRSFLVACQKTSDIYHFIMKEYEPDFIKAIFFGTLIFVMKIRRGDDLMWNEESKLSYSLGSSKYPLFRFCYHYITSHIILEDEIDVTYEEFLEAQLYDMLKSNADPDVNIVLSFHTEKEANIRNAIKNIESRLKKDVTDISFGVYGVLANYLICLTQYIDCDISKCLRLLINNLEGRGDKILEYHLFRYSVKIEDEKKKQEFLRQRESMILALNPDEKSIFSFDYDPKNVMNFCDRIYAEKGLITGDKSFMKRLNVNKFADMIFRCSSLEISKLRQMFGYMYSGSNISDYLIADKEPLSEFLKLIKEYDIPKEFDSIQIMQKDYLINNIEGYIDNLS